MFFSKRDVRNKVPRFEFIGVKRFSGVVFGETFSKIAGRADVGLVRKILASENVRVIHGARLRLPNRNLRMVVRFE